MTSKSQVTLTFAGEDKQLKKTFDSVERRADKLKSAFGKIGKAAAIGGAAIGAAAIAGGTALFKLGESFDAAYDTIITGTGATGKALEGLEDSFKNVLKTGPDSMDAVATAIADLNTATGQTGKPLEDLSRQFLDLSRITKTDLGGNIKSVTRLFGDWGVAVDDQAEALDKLFVVSQNTGTSVDKLADMAVKAGAPFRQLGFTFEDTTALIGKWNKEGVNTEILISGIRQAISKLAREGKDIPSTFREVVQAIEETGSASEATAMAIELFGAEAGPDMAAAIREGRFSVEDLTAAMEDAEGQIGRTADQTASFSEKWGEFKNKLKVALEPAATKVFDKLGEFFDWAGPKIEDDVIPAIEDFWDSFSDAKSVGTKFGDFGEATRDVFDGIVEAGTAAKDFLVDDFWPAMDRVATDSMNVWDEVSPEIQDSFDQIGRAFSTMSDEMKRGSNDSTGEMSLTWERFYSSLVSTATRNLESLVVNTGRSFQLMSGTVQTTAGFMQGDWSKMWAGIRSVTFTDSAKTEAIFRGMWESVKSGARQFVGAVPAILAGMPNAIARALSTVASAIWKPFRDGYNTAVQWANKIPGISIKGPTVQLSNVASNLRAPTSRSSGSFSQTTTTRSTGTLQRRHSGGVVPGTIGREVPIMAKAGEHVVTANQMAALTRARQAGSAPVVIEIRSGGSRIDDVIVELMRKSIANRGGGTVAVLG